jgi:hypothetical protein
MQEFVKYVEKEVTTRTGESPEEMQNALVRVIPPYLIRMRR